jgi:hypothetical protein
MEWPESKEGHFAKGYLLPLMKQGTSTFIKNATTKLHIIKINNKIIPITENEKEYENNYLLSSYYIIPYLKEKLPSVFKPFLSLGGLLLKLLKVNRVIIVNNWLMNVSPYPELSEEEVSLILQLLQEHFPHHYFMFRSINTYQDNLTLNLLKKKKCHIFRSRFCYLYDPQQSNTLPSSMLRKQKKDFRKIARQNYQIEEVTHLSPEESSRLLDLYNQVYISKYTKFSPQYTPQYLEQLLENKIVNLKLLKKEGQIYGSVGFVQREGHLITNFFGYDTTIPQEEGLYRMLSGIIMSEINKTNLLGNHGSGAATFKLWRGYSEEPEYIAIFDHHLPMYRSLFWSVAEKCGYLFKKKQGSGALVEEHLEQE